MHQVPDTMAVKHVTDVEVLLVDYSFDGLTDLVELHPGGADLDSLVYCPLGGINNAFDVGVYAADLDHQVAVAVVTVVVGGAVHIYRVSLLQHTGVGDSMDEALIH